MMEKIGAYSIDLVCAKCGKEDGCLTYDLIVDGCHGSNHEPYMDNEEYICEECITDDALSDSNPEKKKNKSLSVNGNENTIFRIYQKNGQIIEKKHSLTGGYKIQDGVVSYHEVVNGKIIRITIPLFSINEIREVLGNAPVKKN